MNGHTIRSKPTVAEIEEMRMLLPFLEAGRRGLKRSRWMPGMDVDSLVAPVVLAVLVEVAETFNLAAIPIEAVTTRTSQSCRGEGR